jgi:hypothetical protein
MRLRMALEPTADLQPMRHSPAAAARHRRAQPGAATHAAQPEGMRRMNGRRRRGTDSRCALGPREEPPPTRHSPEVRAGTGSREAADEAPPRGVRSNRQQSRHRCGKSRKYAPNVAAGRRRRGTASRCELEPAAETPPTRPSLEVCAGTGSRDATDAAQPDGMRRMWQLPGVRRNRQQSRR